MKVDRVVLRLFQLPASKPFENRWERYTEWKKLIVEVRAEGGSGIGECSTMHTPYYSYETNDTAWHVIETYLAPLLLGTDLSDPRAVAPRFAMVHGHHEARSAVEAACWDLIARARSVPLCNLLGGESRPVATGATIGIDADWQRVERAVAEVVDDGYRRAKVKIKPGHDHDLLARLRRSFPELPILADANGVYREDDLPLMRRIDEMGLATLEQPFPARAISLAARLHAGMRTPLCLDESISESFDLEDAVAQRACDVVNLKIGRLGGLARSLAAYVRCREAGLRMFVGAKYETEVGRLTNIAFATLPGIDLPSDVAAGARYFPEPITDLPVELVSPGHVQPLPGPGIGTSLRPEMLRTRLVRSKELKS